MGGERLPEVNSGAYKTKADITEFYGLRFFMMDVVYCNRASNKSGSKFGNEIYRTVI